MTSLLVAGVVGYLDFVSAHTVQEIWFVYCREHTQYKRYGLLFLLTYVFLLRLPSESLPAVVGASDSQTSVILEGDTITLALKRRQAFRFSQTSPCDVAYWQEE